MRTVYKYLIKINDNAEEVEAPAGVVVAVGTQPGRPLHLALWMEVDLDRPIETRCYRVFGTGHPIPAQAKYVGTVFSEPFVWHVYEV